MCPLSTYYLCVSIPVGLRCVGQETVHTIATRVEVSAQGNAKLIKLLLERIEMIPNAIFLIFTDTRPWRTEVKIYSSFSSKYKGKGAKNRKNTGNFTDFIVSALPYSRDGQYNLNTSVAAWEFLALQFHRTHNTRLRSARELWRWLNFHVSGSNRRRSSNFQFLFSTTTIDLNV